MQTPPKQSPAGLSSLAIGISQRISPIIGWETRPSTSAAVLRSSVYGGSSRQASVDMTASRAMGSTFSEYKEKYGLVASRFFDGVILSFKFHFQTTDRQRRRSGDQGLHRCEGQEKAAVVLQMHDMHSCLRQSRNTLAGKIAARFPSCARLAARHAMRARWRPTPTPWLSRVRQPSPTGPCLLLRRVF